jgi:hypothetical protein
MRSKRVRLNVASNLAQRHVNKRISDERLYKTWFLLHLPRIGIEDGLLSVMEARLPQFNGPQNLHALALPGHGNFWGTTNPAPGGMQGGILAKAGLVGDDQCPVLPLRFFLRLG